MRVLRALPLLAFCLLALAACGADESSEGVEWSELEAAIEAYLPKLAEAYATGDAAVLEGLAAPKEIARIDMKIDELYGQGRTLEPEFVDLKVEKVDIWGYANAFVNTVEIWNIRSYATGTHAQVGEDLGKSNRVKYQFKREGDRWLVLYRTISD